MIDNEIIEEKMGEVLGLEMAAQKAVEQLVSKGLLDKSANRVGTTSIHVQCYCKTRDACR